MASIRTGHVILGGVKIWVAVRDSGKNHWVSTRIGQLAGPRLRDVEKRLKKIRHAQRSLADQKVVAI